MPNEETKKFTRKRNRRGSGVVFQKVAGGAWHLQYYAPELDPITGKAKAKRVREYTKLKSKSQAQKLLNDRLGKIGRGEPVSVGRPVTVAELYTDLRTFTENNSRAAEPQKAWAGAGGIWAHTSVLYRLPA